MREVLRKCFQISQNRSNKFASQQVTNQIKSVKFQSVIQSAFFSDELCLYIVEVASPYGCIQETVTSHNCTITHPDTGNTLSYTTYYT